MCLLRELRQRRQIGEFQKRVARGFNPQHAGVGANGMLHGRQIRRIDVGKFQVRALPANAFEQAKCSAVKVVPGDDMRSRIQSTPARWRLPPDPMRTQIRPCRPPDRRRSARMPIASGYGFDHNPVPCARLANPACMCWSYKSAASPRPWMGRATVRHGSCACQMRARAVVRKNLISRQRRGVGRFHARSFFFVCSFRRKFSTSIRVMMP